MTERDIKLLIDLAKKLKKEKTTKEEAMQELISAGIFTKKGNYTKPYRELEKLRKKRLKCTTQDPAS